MLHFPKMPNNDELLIDELVIMECNENDIELLVLIKLSEKRQERCIKFVEYPCKQILYLTHFFFITFTKYLIIFNQLLNATMSWKYQNMHGLCNSQNLPLIYTISVVKK